VTSEGLGSEPAPAIDPPGTAPDGGPYNPRRTRDALVTDLAADLLVARGELEELRREAGNTAALTRDVTSLLAETVPRVDELAYAVAQLWGRVDALAEAEPAPSNPPVPWPMLCAADAEHAWTTLAEWVSEVLGPWYELTRGQLPDCWPLHRPAVIELSWLRTSYVQAYLPRSASHLAAEWHARWRRDALANIAAAIPARWCRPGEHLVHEQESETARRDAATPTPTPAHAEPTPPSWASTRVAAGAQRVVERAAAALTAPTRTTQPAAERGDRAYQETARDHISLPEHWLPAYRQALAADLDWRRARETTAGVVASRTLPGEDRGGDRAVGGR
jgi:hypothetical protein